MPVSYTIDNEERYEKYKWLKNDKRWAVKDRWVDAAYSKRRLVDKVAEIVSYILSNPDDRIVLFFYRDFADRFPSHMDSYDAKRILAAGMKGCGIFTKYKLKAYPKQHAKKPYIAIMKPDCTDQEVEALADAVMKKEENK